MHRKLFPLLTLLLAIGCTQSTDTAKKVPDDAPLNLGPGRENVTQTDTPARPSAKAVAVADEDPPAAKGGKPKTGEDYFKLASEAAEKGDIEGLESNLEQAVKLVPENANWAFNLANLKRMYATQLTRAGETKKAYPKIVQAAAILRKLHADGKLGEEASNMVAAAIMAEAQAHATAKETKKAIASLREVLDLGFDDLPRLAKDPDLEELCKSPEFEALAAEYGPKIAKHAREEAAKALAEHKAFAFDFELEGIDGKPVKLADFKGKIVLVDFWGTWCGPCRMVIPNLIDLQKKYKDDIQIVGLSYERNDLGLPLDAAEAKPLIKEFMTENEMNYPSLLGTEAVQDQVKPEFQGFPTLVFLDREGKVRLSMPGYHSMASLEAIVGTLLEEKAEAATKTPAEDKP